MFGTLIPELSVQIGGMTFNSFWIGSVAVVLLTGLYTVLGGMRAVAYTEAVQTFILIIGSLRAHRLRPADAWAAGPSSVPRSRPTCSTCGSRSSRRAWRARGRRCKETGRMAWYFNTNYPWIGMLFCAPIIGLWYWCTDQYIVQRTLGAPNETEARRGSIFAAFLKLLPVFIFIIPGMIAVALARTRQGARPRGAGGRQRQVPSPSPRRRPSR